MSLLLLKEFTPINPDISNLINDPHSIPIERPNDASHLVADAVAKKLPTVVRNSDILTLIDPEVRKRGEVYKRQLANLKPLYPQVLADLFELTPAGVTAKMIKRFSTTRTLSKVIPLKSYMESITQAGNLLLNTIMNRISKASRTPGHAHPPPFACCEQLRSFWKLDFTHSSIGVYTPFDFEIDHGTSTAPGITVSCPANADLLNTIGTSPPNFGTSTKQKISQHGYKIVNTNSTISDLKRAVLMYSELQGDISVEPFFNSIIQARSPWTLTQLLPRFPHQIGGATVHRHQSRTHKFSMLGSNSVASHITFGTDFAGILSGGEADYPVVFQTPFMTGMNLFQSLADIFVSFPSTIKFLIPNSLREIDATPCRSTAIITPPQWPDLKRNKLAWVGKLFTTEIPVLPDPTRIPHIFDIKDDISLLYSLHEIATLHSDATFGPWDGILATKDFMDLKEVSRIDPKHAEFAFTWILISDTMSAFVGSGNRNIGGKSFSTYILSRSLYLAGKWVRVRLHKSFLASEYNIRRRIALQPTENGYKRPVEYIASILRRKAQIILTEKNYDIIPPLMLFSDWKNTTAYLSHRRLALSIGYATYPNVDKEQMRNYIRSVTPPRTLLESDPTNYLLAVETQLRKGITKETLEFPILRSVFINMSKEDAVRLLRVREKNEHVIVSSTAVVPTFANHGFCKYEINGDSGDSIPSLITPPLPIIDRYRSLRRRTRGEFSPLYSDWNAVLLDIIKRQELKSKKHIHMIGIGRGAIARSLIEQHKVVVGYDLRKTFPTLSHRSEQYVPPEVNILAKADKFRWSQHTILTDGDCSKGLLDLECENSPAVIVDVDLPYSDLSEILKKIPTCSTLLLRYTGTEEQIRQLISIYQPIRVYGLVVSESQVKDAILLITSGAIWSEGNYLNTEFTKRQELSYTYAQHNTLQQLFYIDPAIHNLIIGQHETEDERLISQQLLLLSRAAYTEVTPEYVPVYLLLHKSAFDLNGKELRVKVLLDRLLDLSI